MFDAVKTAFRNCFAVASLRPKPCTTLARFARSPRGDNPVFSGLDAPHAWFRLPSHSPLWGFVTAPTLRAGLWVPPLACFAAHGYPLLRALFNTRFAHVSKVVAPRLFVTALSNRYAVSREPRHFDPRSCPPRGGHSLQRRVAVARFAIWPRRHGLRPRYDDGRLGVLGSRCVPLQQAAFGCACFRVLLLDATSCGSPCLPLALQGSSAERLDPATSCGSPPEAAPTD